MKKLLLLVIIALALVGVVIATQTVKTITLPLGIETISTANTIYYRNVTINPPDGISEILSFELEVQGDYYGSTNIYGGFLAYDIPVFCNPNNFLVPTSQFNYRTSFDCTNYIGNWKGDEEPIIFMWLNDFIMGNVKPYVHLTYKNLPEKQPPNIDVLGTYYEVGDVGKVIAQLSADGIPINNASCYASVYYPDDSVLFRNNFMSLVDNSDGLYTYDVNIPNNVGVYPISVVCDYITEEVDIFIDDYDLIIGSHLNGTLNDTYYEDDEVLVLQSTLIGDICALEIDLFFNVSNATYDNASEFFVKWVGVCYKEGATGYLYWYNVNTSSWDVSSNSISHTTMEQYFYPPNDIDNYVNGSGMIKVKLNGSSPTFLSEIQFVDVDFEMGTFEGFQQTIISGNPTFLLATGVTAINGSYSAQIEGSGGSGNDENGALDISFNTTDVENISISYTRESVGAESNDDFFVRVSNDNGTTWYTLESWSANSAETRQTFVLNSSYDNQSNITLRFESYVNHGNDIFRFDDVIVSAYIVVGGIFDTDMMELMIVNPTGVVNEIRGGGEFNVKDRIAGIEEDIDELIDELVTNAPEHQLEFLVSPVIDKNDIFYAALYLHDYYDTTFGEADANCSITLIGPVNSSGYGPVVFTEIEMENEGAGHYHYINDSLVLDVGVYTLEANCIDGGTENHYNMIELRVEDNNISQFDIVFDNLSTIISGLNNLSTELPIVMIGGTEYESGEEGLIAVRLMKTVGSSQSLITGATCTADILYPNATHFVNDDNLTEWGEGIYYYNFTTPLTEGVYIYSVDCADGSKDYYAMNTFHVAHWANSIGLLTSVIDYLQNINTTVTTIDGRTISMYEVINDTNNRLILLNGTVYDMYDLLLQMNSTLTTIYTLASSINATVVDIQGTVNNIETVILSINGTIVIIQGDIIAINDTVNDIQADITSINSTIENIYDLVFDINGTVYDIEGDISIIDGKIDIINGTVNNIENVVLSLNSTVNGIDVKIGEMNGTLFDIIDYLQDINNTQYNYSTELSSILTYLQDINNSQYDYSDNLSDIYALLLLVNSTQVNYSSELSQLLNFANDINSTITDIYAVSVATNTTVNDIYILNQQMNLSLNQIYALNVVMNGTLNSIVGSLSDMNLTLSNIENATISIENDLIVINGTVNNIEGVVITINSTVNNIETKVDTAINYILQINGTVTNIENGIIEINTTSNTIYDLLSAMNENVTSIYGLSININSSLAQMNTTLQDIYAVSLNINDSNILIYDIVMNISEDLESLTNLTLSINTSCASYLLELLYIQEQINNLTMYLADVSYFVGVNSSDYYNESTLQTPIILETQLLEFEINILQTPIEGSTYRINYFFFDDEGSLVKEEQEEVIGVGQHSIYISSDDIDVNSEEEYNVWMRVEMLNGDGFWQSFPLEFIDTLTIQPLTSNALKGAGLYDVIVGSQYHVYEESEKVRIGLLIKNTGDSPDEDTILTYWLEAPDGTRYGETREQFLEVPPGSTYLERTLFIPLGVDSGEWKVQAQYETVVQPTIQVYDGFELRQLSVLDKVQLRAPAWIKQNWLFSIILGLLLLSAIIFISIASAVKEKKKRSDTIHLQRNNR